MRYRKADIYAPVKKDLRVEFTETGLTSYSGLELLIRYFRSIRFNDLIRRHFNGIPFKGDYSVVAMVRLVLGLLIIGGRRLGHVDFLRGDVLFLRFCGLSRLPSTRTVSRWLKNFKMAWLVPLQTINAEIIAQTVRKLPLRTLSIDVDGSVVSTGLKVARAFRGFNPHRRKVHSYYPITAHLSETGHVLRVKNRPGNVHDGKASLSFLRDIFTQVGSTMSEGYRLNFRMDSAFFDAPVIRLLKSKGAGYTIKVPFWQWVGLKPLIEQRRRWKRIDHRIQCFEKEIHLAPWNTTLRVVIYRKRVHHKTRKNYQLDLFDPDNGHYEYSAVATNLPWTPRNIWNFMCGRGAHEKAIGELKSGLAFDTIPTNAYGANSAWQQFVVLAHNLLTNFQIDTGAPKRKTSSKRTARFILKSIQ
ncbi:MAG: IS1380 family transposase, partial [Candidatus Latescibacterota bacterium]